MNIRQIIREELENIIHTDIHGKKSSSVDYTAVVIEGEEAKNLEKVATERIKELGVSIPSTWNYVRDYHMTITMGPLGLGQLMSGAIGSRVELTIVSIGISNDAIALGVTGLYSRNEYQHITFAFKNNSRDSNDIKNWHNIKPFKVVGYVREIDKLDGFGRLSQIDESARSGKLILSEDQKPLPRQFDHLKWKLGNNQKYYLQDLCEVDPNSMRESDYKSASKFLGIPEKNIKSIINTYNTYDPMSEAVFESSPDSPLRIGNKPITVGEVLSAKEANRAPVKASRTTWQTQDTITPAYKKTMRMGGVVIDKKGNVSDKKVYYENLKTSLMMYLFCEINPKDISLNHRGQIQIDQEPILEEHESFNMENHTFRKIKTLIKSFNKMFDCSFRIFEHVDLSEKKQCHRTIIELFGLASDKWYWDGDKNWVKPGNPEYNKFKENYIENDGIAHPMPEVPVVNHREMLDKYFNGDLISYNPSADWLL